MGEFQHSIDSKGRLIIPAKFRDQLGSKCLFGYPMDEWRVLEEKLKKLPLNKRDARSFVRFFYSAATESELDKQGRINVPKTLRSHAGLEKKCVIVGVSNRFEIWSEERWNSFTDEAEENFDEIAENMIDFEF